MSENYQFNLAADAVGDAEPDLSDEREQQIRRAIDAYGPEALPLGPSGVDFLLRLVDTERAKVARVRVAWKAWLNGATYRSLYETLDALDEPEPARRHYQRSADA